MSRVLVTGMSGVGKTTVFDVLSGRGVVTVDTDYDDLVLPDGRGSWHSYAERRRRRTANAPPPAAHRRVTAS